MASGQEARTKTQSIYDIQDLPPYRMLFRLAWPVILSMLVQGLYNIIDTLYLCRLGEEVLSAMSLAIFLSSFRSVSLIWWCWPISEIVSDCVSVSFFIYSYRRIKRENSSLEPEQRIR